MAWSLRQVVSILQKRALGLSTSFFLILDISLTKVSIFEHGIYVKGTSDNIIYSASFFSASAEFFIKTDLRSFICQGRLLRHMAFVLSLLRPRSGNDVPRLHGCARQLCSACTARFIRSQHSLSQGTQGWRFDLVLERTQLCTPNALRTLLLIPSTLMGSCRRHILSSSG